MLNPRHDMHRSRFTGRGSWASGSWLELGDYWMDGRLEVGFNVSKSHAQAIYPCVL